MTSCTVDVLIHLMRDKPLTTITFDKDTCFKITASQFRDFAIEDSKTESVHHQVNTLSNVKRAIECRVDELLYTVCLHVKSEREKWNFPKKIQALGKIGVLAPRILEKINSKRNQLEHQYIKPTKDDVEDALDVAILFLGYTDRIYNDGSPPLRFSGKGYSVEINRKEGVFRIKDSQGMRKAEIGDEDDWLEIAKLLLAQAR